MKDIWLFRGAVTLISLSVVVLALASAESVETALLSILAVFAIPFGVICGLWLAVRLVETIVCFLPPE